MTLLVLAGPTAAGKTEAALHVARRYGAVVVSADAMQVYRGMDIGTATPDAEERGAVPHYGLDCRDPDDDFDAAAFVALTEEVIALGEPVVVAGGTSFYLRALLRGLVETPPVDPELRAELEALEDLHGELARVDPELARRLHPNDRVRLVRGVEVFRQTGQRLSELQAAHARAPDRHEAVGLWLDREDLYARIDLRVERMMEAGYLDEVRALLDAGVDPDGKPMRSLGYRHLVAHLRDGLPLDEAVRLTQRDTRHFARKQRTWLRNLGFERVLPPHLPAVERAANEAFGPPRDGGPPVG